MIDVTRIRYDLVAITPQGERYHITDALQGLSWEEQPAELAVRLNIEAHILQVGGQWLHQLLPLGGKVVLYSDWGAGWQEVFRGTVFRAGHQTDPLGHFGRRAYDDLIYLMRSTDDRYYPAGTTGRTIIQDVAREWGLPLGTVEGPDVPLAKQVFRRRELASIIADVLEQSVKRGAPRLIVRARDGTIDVIRRGTNSPVYHFGAESNVQAVADEMSIENLVTRVKIIGAEDSDERRPVVAVRDGDTRWGILQDLVYQDQYDTPAAAAEAAQAILDERGQPERVIRVVAPDLPFLRKGDMVHITAGTLNGYCYVEGVSHDAMSRQMTMEVVPVE